MMSSMLKDIEKQKVHDPGKSDMGRSENLALKIRPFSFTIKPWNGRIRVLLKRDKPHQPGKYEKWSEYREHTEEHRMLAAGTD